MKREHNSFKTPLDVRLMDSGKRFRLLHSFTYRWKGLNLSVPRGFVTDFASIPRFARIIIPKLGRYSKAAVIHDWLYRRPVIETGFGLTYLSRKTSDQVFRDGMAELGVTPWKRFLMYWAVRMFGFLAWKVK